jgi:hypothetical protein
MEDDASSCEERGEVSTLRVIHSVNEGAGLQLANVTEKRFVRRRVPPAERDFIYNSTGGKCYLCKTTLRRLERCK